MSLSTREISRIVEERITGGSRPYRMPMPDALLKECNFFDLYPLDGGGGLFSHSIIPTTDDAEYARRILEEGALDDFGELPRIDHHRYERWRSIEKSCWINRLYFLVPLAKTYAAGGGEALARLITDTIINFIDTCPPPNGREEIERHQSEVFCMRDAGYNARSYEENYADETDVRYIWFDFQPASRVLHLLYTIHLLKGSPSVTGEEWRKIVRFLYRHGEVIYYGELRRGINKEDGNHQSLRGLSLIYLGTFFHGFGLWAEFIKRGVETVEFHDAEGFAEDGSLKENSPSYHAFQMWHVRDACLLSKEYGFELGGQVREHIRRQAAFMKAVTSPDGMSVVINDGYPVSSASYLLSLDFVEHTGSKEATFFPDAGMASLKRNGLWVFLDASPFTGRFSHYHAGKNAITLWLDGRPFFIDSGCSEYDDNLFSKWYKQPEAHSSLLINGEGDGEISSIYSFASYPTPACTGWDCKDDGSRCITARLTSSSPVWKGVVWVRCIHVNTDDTLCISDEITAPDAVDASLVFNLHPDVYLKLTGDKSAELVNEGVKLLVEWKSSAPLSIEDAEGKSYVEFRHRDCRRLLVHAPGQSSCIIRTIIHRA